MKILIFGLGSIGKRHAANLRLLRPDARIVTADPAGGADYADWLVALAMNFDSDCAVIASPEQCHLEQMQALAAHGIRFYVEKPPCLISQIDAYHDVVTDCASQNLYCAVGFQYRYHAFTGYLPAMEHKRIAFYARDALLSRYGPTVQTTMASHALDLALWLLGPAEFVNLKSNGVKLTGDIQHRRGGISEYDYEIDSLLYESSIYLPGASVSLLPDDTAYQKSMAAFLDKRRGYATLSDGLDVMEALAQCETY